MIESLSVSIVSIVLLISYSRDRSIQFRDVMDPDSLNVCPSATPVVMQQQIAADLGCLDIQDPDR
jgi:hypothetical protein